MKLLTTIILSILVFSSFNAQKLKLKKKTFYFHYLSTPTETKQISPEYTWEVRDESVNERGVYSNITVEAKTLNNDPISVFYKAKLDALLGFNCVKQSKNSYNDGQYKPYNLESIIVLDIAPLFVSDRVIKTNGKLTNTSGVTGNALSYEFKFSIGRSLIFSSYLNEPLYVSQDLNNASTFTYNFPGDFRGLDQVVTKGYWTEQELEAAYLKNRNVFYKQIKDLIVSKWIDECLAEITSMYAEVDKFFGVNLYYIKDKKDSENDFELALEKMDRVETITKESKATSSKKNWHTKEADELLKFCENFWYEALEKEKSLDASGQGEWDEEMFLAITKNWLFAKFLLREHKMVLESLKVLNNLEDPNREIKQLNLDVFLEFGYDYQKRYEINAQKYGWDQY